MKKNRMMRLASGLLVAVLATTSVISGTYAKYVTSDNASDVARVAKWGVEVIASGSLFGQHYAAADDNGIIASDTGTVASSDGNNVVAPGTKNVTGMTFKVTGTPEVDSTIVVTEMDGKEFKNIFLKKGDYAVMVEAVGVTADNFTDYYVETSADNYAKATGSFDPVDTYYEVHDAVNVVNDYYPIKWTLTDDVGGTKVTLADDTTETLFAALQGVLNTTTNQATVAIDKSYTITWEWDFDDNGAGTNDGADTILGNIVAGLKVVEGTEATGFTAIADSSYCYDVEFNAEITVTQVD